MKKLLTIDLDWIQHPRQFMDILSICMDLFKKQTPTVFINAHHEIYEHIEEGATVINIDHHHDFGYDQQASVKGALDNRPREGNWVLAAAIHKKIKGYIWVKNYNSMVLPDEITDWMRKLEILQIRNRIDEVDLTDIDKLVICESAEYEKNVSLYLEILKTTSKGINSNTVIAQKKNPFKHLNS